VIRVYKILLLMDC